MSGRWEEVRMHASASRRVLCAVLACGAAWWPGAASAQTPTDTVLLSTPPLAGTTCHDETATIPQAVARRAKAFVFEVGLPGAQIRLADGPVLAQIPPPREISVFFDSLGAPMMLADALTIGCCRVSTAVVYFVGGVAGTGFRQDVTADSAAVMARFEREGLNAGLASIRQEGRQTQTPLDSTARRRARALADTLWQRRCP